MKQMLKSLSEQLDLSYAERAIEELTEARDELQEKYDNLSEKAQDGERGQAMSYKLDKLNEAVDYAEALKTAYEDLDGALSDLVNNS